MNYSLEFRGRLTPPSFAFQPYRTLETAYAIVRQNLETSQWIANNLYDLGARARVFQPGDQDRILYKAKQQPGNKYLSK